jgi:hypothetical protein
LVEAPLPVLISLSAAKAGQQNLVESLSIAFGDDIHFGLVKVNGLVKPEANNMNPRNIAEKIVEFYEQPKGAWKLKTEIND